jgi:RNA polymerase sigma-70 factor, ECF subfamily
MKQAELPEPGTLGSASDADLVARAQQGEEAAFASLFEAHKGRVYALCLRISGSPAEAEDLSQAAFLKLFRRISTFRGDSTFSTWLHRLVLNEVFMHLRKKRKQEVSIAEADSSGEKPAIVEYGRDDLRLTGAVDRISLSAALAKLSPGYRTAFVLHDVNGYDHREIARMMKWSVGNSKSQLHKARRRLRQLLQVEARSQQPAARAVKLCLPLTSRPLLCPSKYSVISNAA